MGRAALYDLAASRDVEEIVVADFDRARAQEAVRSFGRGKARAVFADVRKTQPLAQLMRGCAVVLNCTQYYWNVAVMQAALRAGVHYLDLGGLYHVTLQQLRLCRDFERAGKLALVGMGGTPGITNVMARYLADQLERVDSIAIFDGARELNPSPDPLAYTFSIATILDEMTLEPVVFERRRCRKVPLFSGEEVVRFPAPVGRLVVRHSIHSELATLPESFRSQGVRDVSFKINYDPRLIAAVQLLARLGLTDRKTVTINGASACTERSRSVSPRAVLEKLLKRSAVSSAAARDVEILRVVVSGRNSGRPCRLQMDATARYTLRPSLSAVARDTGFPASIAAQMIARGEIRATGVRAPEEVVPPKAFFRELGRRGIPVRVQKPPSGRA